VFLPRSQRFLVIAKQPFGQHINALLCSGIEPVGRKPPVLIFML
jgi:hypothetical protein